MSTDEQLKTIVKEKYGTIDENGVNKVPLLYDLIKYNQQSRTLITKSSDKQEWAFIMKTHPVN